MLHFAERWSHPVREKFPSFVKGEQHKTHGFDSKVTVMEITCFCSARGYSFDTQHFKK